MGTGFFDGKTLLVVEDNKQLSEKQLSKLLGAHLSRLKINTIMASDTVMAINNAEQVGLVDGALIDVSLARANEWSAISGQTSKTAL